MAPEKSSLSCDFKSLARVVTGAIVGGIAGAVAGSAFLSLFYPTSKTALGVGAVLGFMGGALGGACQSCYAPNSSDDIVSSGIFGTAASVLLNFQHLLDSAPVNPEAKSSLVAASALGSFTGAKAVQIFLYRPKSPPPKPAPAG